MIHLESIILSEVRQRKTDIIYITYMWNLKNNTNESIYKTEKDLENELVVTKGQERRG